MTKASDYQPDPKQGEKIVVDVVLSDIRERAETGKRKYGTYLETHNGRNALWDAYQEAIDLVMYLRQAILEQERHITPIALDAPYRRCPACKALLEESSVYCDTCGTDTPVTQTVRQNFMENWQPKQAGFFERLVLLFIKEQNHISFDDEIGTEVVLVYKKLFDVIYIIHCVPLPPKHVNCRCAIALN